MDGVPATVISNGKVYSSGSFSFYVTCVFDFSDYPYDVQNCPIVIADWVYDLSKVNLSDPVPTQLTKPVIRLSFDPDPLGNDDPKKHVAGWEVQDTWRKHCYWGPKGCLEADMPSGPLDTYWSLLEFGIQLKRHAPYYGLTIVLPALTTTIITLIVFLIDDYSMALSITMLNLLFQGFCSWSLLKQLPPANGNLPRIGQYFGYTLVLTAFSYAIHAIFQFLLVTIPGDIEFPFQLTTTIITLIVFLIDDYSMALSITMLNLLFQGFCSWSLLKQLPPANGNLPRIGQYFGYTLVLTAFSYAIHAIFQFLLVTIPGDIEFPFQFTNITEKLRELKFFKVEGLSFDPQSVLLGEDTVAKNDPELSSIQENHHSNNNISNDTTATVTTNEETLVEIDTPPSSTIDLSEANSFNPEKIEEEEIAKESESQEVEQVAKKVPTISNQSHLAEELYT
uniref:Neurotransmitter-gated ion-channel ligand-binding domain-containing protein n=1 Tax=Panagrolaimus sp. ES5 TaxID=591445 RepID=A0AC34G3T8_9BILA